MFEKVMLVMGLFAFAKQAPKLISDVLGIDSGNLKLGIGGKLAAGGFLGAASVLGGALTTGARNFVNGAKTGRNNWKEKVGEAQGGFKKVSAGVGAVFSGVTKTIGSTVAGTASGAGRSFFGGATKAKTVSDVMNTAGKGAKEAVQAREHRKNYVATHGGVLGAIGGHIEDFGGNVQDWFNGGFEAEESEIKFYNQVLEQNSKLKSATESLRGKNGDNTSLLDGLKVKFSKNATEQSAYEKMFSKFDGMNLNAIRQYIDQQKSTTVDRKEFMIEQEVTRNGKVVVTQEFDDQAYQDAVLVKAQQDAQLEKMFRDVTTAVDLRIQTAAFDPQISSDIGIDANKLSEIKNNMTQINDLLRTGGQPTIDFHMQNINQNEIGQSMKDVVTDIEVSRNNKAAEVERKKRAREQRQSNKNSSK